jgi:hypothetical protein
MASVLTLPTQHGRAPIDLVGRDESAPAPLATLALSAIRLKLFRERASLA